MASNLKFHFVLAAILLPACTTVPAPLNIAENPAEITPVTEGNNINIVINAKNATHNANGEPLICKESKKTGSRLQTIKSCYTKAEWDAIKRETQDVIQRIHVQKTGSIHQ